MNPESIMPIIAMAARFVEEGAEAPIDALAAACPRCGVEPSIENLSLLRGIVNASATFACVSLHAINQ